jgi:single-strand DNA-binding protein
MTDNAITLIGNITRDPELGFTKSGVATASFGLAVNRRWKNHTTDLWEESTSFFDVVCWREMAENVAGSLTRGARAVVVGRLEQRTWETSEGEKRSKVEVVADDVAPSLRWACTQITRNERKGPSEPGGSPTPSGRLTAAPAPVPAAAGGYGFDEEPF